MLRHSRHHIPPRFVTFLVIVFCFLHAPAALARTVKLGVGRQTTLTVDSQKAHTWKSSDTAVARVGKKTGLVKGISRGTCQITCTFKNKEQQVFTVKVVKNKRPDTFPLYGHRGDTDSYPENSLPGFRSAVSKGLFGIECDLWCSRSGDLLVFHDSDLVRLCGSSTSIFDITAASRFQYPLRQGAYSASHKVYIPTLEEMLSLMANNGGTVLLHLKYKGSFDPAGLKKVTELIRQYNMQDRIVIFCHDKTTLKRLRSSGLALGFLSYYTDDAANKKAIRWCVRHGVSRFFCFLPENISAKVVRYAHKKGMRIGMYKTRTKRDLQFLYDIDADFAMLYHFSLASYKG